MKNTTLNQHVSKRNKSMLRYLISLFVLLLSINGLWAQQAIGLFSFMDGGFEGQTVGAAVSTSVASGATYTNWTTSSSSVATLQSTIARTGSKSANFNPTSTTKRLQSPTAPSPAQQAVPATAYTIQYYYRTAGATGTAVTMQAGLSAAGTGDGSYTTAVAFAGTSGAWVKYSTAFTTKSGTTPSSPVGIIRASIAIATAIDVDDFCVYLGSLDETAPDAPTTPVVSAIAAKQMTISWTAPTTGVDGGGYMVVRGLANPATTPNTNGIYAVGNTVAAGEQVVYIGTDPTFNDTGLAPSTSYYYRIYTVDKAFNYSTPVSVNSATVAPSYATEPTINATSATFANVTSSGFDINWTAGDGANSLVVVKAVNAVDTNPEDGNSYSANTTFGSGAQNGTGNFVVYNGTGTTVSVTGLTKASKYYVSVYTFNGTGGTENYLLTTPALGNQMTLPAEIVSTGTNSAGITWATAAAWVGNVVPGPGDNVTIATGDKIQVGASASCYNLTVQTGAKLYNNNLVVGGTMVYMTIYGTSVTVNGTLGDQIDAATSDCALGINFVGNLTFSGTGTIRPARIRPNASTQNATLTVNADMQMTYTGSAGTGGSAIYTDNSGNNNITITVNTGKTLSFVDLGNLNTASSSTTNGTSSTTFNIDGTVNLPANSNLSLPIATDKTCSLNVNGTLNVGKLNATSAAGGAVPTITVGSTGAINVSGSADFSSPTLSANVTGAGAFSLGTGATISIASATGLEPVAGPIQTSIRNFNTAASYSYVGTSAQVTGSNLPSTVNNLTINNAAGVSLGASTTVNGILTFTSGQLNLGAYNLTVGTAGSIVGASATNYIVTDGTGSLFQPIAASGTVVFPIGSSATSYDPASLTPTDATVVSINVGTTLPAIAYTNYYYNAKVWDITSTLLSSTVVSLTPSSAVATTLNDVIGHYVSGNWINVMATKTGNNYTATFSSFSPFVTGTTDLGTGISNAINDGVSFDGKIIHNHANLDLQVYDVTGRKVVYSNKDIHMNSNSSGIYIVKSINSTMKIILIK